MDIMPISTLVPQSGSMVVLDRVISAEEDSLAAEVRIREDSLFCINGSVGTWVGIEYMAQAIAAHAGHLATQNGETVKLGFLLGTRKYECHAPQFKAGSVLDIHVKRLLLTDNGVGSYDCIINDGNNKMANALITVFQPTNADIFIEGQIK